MDRLATHLALHGTIILTISIIGGLFLHKALLNKAKGADWHLLHAGVAARGIMLIALAAIVELPSLPIWLLSTSAWLIIFFVWTSTFAMLIRAITGDKGFGWFGTHTNKVVYVLYAMGTVAIFPGILIFIYGLLNAL